jgi:hypothetical protein
MADEIIQTKGGSYFIIDYKTAKYTSSQDELMPMYEIQLNSYAYIANRGTFSPVSGIGLVYYEPSTDLTSELIDSVLMDSGFQMPFTSHLHPLKLDPDAMIPPQLQRVRDIVDQPKPPDGLDGCEDCENLNRLIRLATS